MMHQERRDLPFIIAIVHVVVDTVQSSLVRTAIFAFIATRRLGALLRRIQDVVPFAGAGQPLEDMEKTKPMSDLVRGGYSQIEVLLASTWNSCSLYVASVLVELGAIAFELLWKCA